MPSGHAECQATRPAARRSPDSRICTLLSPSTLFLSSSQCLKPSGKALVAAKTYYFGVGGGTQAFKAAVQTGGLAVSRDLLIDDPKSVQREIIELTRT